MILPDRRMPIPFTPPGRKLTVPAAGLIIFSLRAMQRCQAMTIGKDRRDGHEPGVGAKGATDVAVQMELTRIIISENNEQQIIFLKEVDGEIKTPYVLNTETQQAIYYYAGLSFKQMDQPDDARKAWTSGAALNPTSALGVKMSTELGKL